MTRPTDDGGWDDVTWTGNRRAQLRRARRLTVRERIEALQSLSEVSHHFDGLRASGRLHDPAVSAATRVAGAVGERRHRYGSDSATGDHEILLPGCTPIPLGSYLKALAVLRLVAEQADPNARGCWRGERFVLRSELGVPALLEFFSRRWRPTPILAPWNAGSGFYFLERTLKERAPETGRRTRTGVRDQPTEATRAIDALLSTSSERLAPIREAAQQCRRLLDSLGLDQAPGDDAKAALLRTLRATLSDDCVRWLDAAVVLQDTRPRFPPLLGTGATDGRLDFTANLVQRVLDLFDPDSGELQPGMYAMLVSALFATPARGLSRAAVGQFAPGAAGGPNAGTGFLAESLVNPWDFVFMIEGALLFSTTTTRRLESGAIGRASFPFTVRSTGSGSGATAIADEASARAEMWMPLWEAPICLPELGALLAEGRVTVGPRAARDGLDFVRAVSRLGVDRGIREFQRYGFFRRAGKQFLATPLNRIRVVRNPGADLADSLEAENWLAQFREMARAKDAPVRVTSLVRRLEDALFDLAREPLDVGPRVRRLLELLGDVSGYLAASPAARGACGPVPLLPEDWVRAAWDGSDELRLAVALASLHARARQPGAGEQKILALRTHISPVSDKLPLRWHDGSARRVVWTAAVLEQDLVAVAQRRLLDADALDLPDKPFHGAAPVPVASIAAWIDGELDTHRVRAMIPGLAHCRIPERVDGATPRTRPVPAAYAMLKPFFCTDEQLHRAGALREDRSLEVPADLVRRLAAGRTDAALDAAWRRLRAAVSGLAGWTPRAAAGLDATRLLAALLAPISDADLRQLLRRLRRRHYAPEE